MPFKLIFTIEARRSFEKLQSESACSKRFKAVTKALGHIQINPKYPGLRTHKHSNFAKYISQEVFQSYAENHTPGAYRIFWHYGPEKSEITILSIEPHP